MLSPLGFLSGFPIHLFPVSIFTLKSVNTLIITALGFFQLFSTSGTTWVYFFWPWFLVTLLWFFTCLVILFIIIWLLRMTHCTDAVFLSIETFWIFSGRQWTCLNSSSKLCVLWVAAAEVHIQFFPMLPAAFCGGAMGRSPACVEQPTNTLGRICVQILVFPPWRHPLFRISLELSQCSAPGPRYIGGCP